MSRCSDYQDWNTLDEDERTEALEEEINNYLSAAGYNEIAVTNEDVSGAAAETDSENGNIALDSADLRDAGRNDAYDTAYHEAWHSMDIQDGVYDRLTDEEKESFNDLSSAEGYYDEDGEMRMDYHYDSPEHDNASAFGQAMSKAVRDECGGEDKAPDVGAESASDGISVEIDWENVVITPASSDDITVEIDLDNVVIEPAGPDN